MKDLILIYHLKPKNVCVAIKLWMVCVFEVVTILAIFKNFRSPEFHQWLVPSHSAPPLAHLLGVSQGSALSLSRLLYYKL